MNLQRTTLFDIIFLFVVFLMGMLSIFSYQRIMDLDRKADYITHTSLVKLRLEQILSHVKEAETNQRGYLLTGDTSYLQQFTLMISDHQEILHDIDSLVSEDKTQQENAILMRKLVTQRIGRLQQSLNTPAGDIYAMREMLTAGKKLKDRLSGLVQQMIRIEDNLLRARIAQKNYAASITPFYSLFLSVLSILAVTVTYFVFKSENKRRYTAEGSFNKLSEYFKDLPAVFAIVKGPGHTHEMVNNLYSEVSSSRSLIGKDFREAFPELKEQGFHDILDEVYEKGEMFVGKEMPFKLTTAGGDDQKSFYNFIFQPLKSENSQPEGILLFGYDITELVMSRVKVEEAEQRSRLAIEAANIGTFDWDLEKSLFRSSDRLLEIFGFTGKDVSHADLLSRFHVEDKPVRDKAVEDSYAKGSLVYEARIIQPGGAIRWVKVYGKILHNAMRETMRMYGTVLDTTEQRNSLEELRRSEARFRLLADSMPQFVWTADVTGRLNYFSKAVYDYTGGEPDHFLADGWVDIVHPEDWRLNAEKWKTSLAAGEEFINEQRLKSKTGDYRWYLTRALPQKSPDGTIQRWVGTSTDIQGQKDLSDSLEKQVIERTSELYKLNNQLIIKNNIFAQAEENALIGSYSWDLRAGELEYSDNLFRLFGFEPGEFVPTFEKYLSLVHPDDQEQVQKNGEETLRRKELVANTYRVITKNGSIKYFRSNGSVIGEADNLFLIGTVQDISQDHHYNDMLQAKNLELERSNLELESFNYIASHDLQEPLRKIQAFSQRIISKDGNSFSEFTRDYFGRIHSAAQRMQNLIEALLSYSKINAFNTPLHPVELNHLVEEVLNDMQESIDEHHAKIACAKLPVITGLDIQLHQLFTNLIGNAIKYRRPGISPVINVATQLVSGKDVVRESIDAAKEYWQITVTDNGIGFEQQYEVKIFELFQRLHGSNDYAGTGIGLAICKKIMRNHGGSITAEGRPGNGATFKLYFPV